jgi:hypothetical protein
LATEQVVEHVAEGLEEAAQVTRELDMGRIGFGLGGLAVGLAFGFYVGYRFNRAKIRAEVLQEAEKDIEQIRLMYRDRNKPTPEAIVREQGYETPEPPRPTRPPVPVREPEPLVEEVSRDEWNYNKEIAQRDRNHPYIIHENEFQETFPEYQQLQWTYYAGDNILSDERDEVVVRPELVVGEENLKRFGHGSSDENMVYIRNDRLEIEWEITRSWKSHAEEVLGLDPDEAQNST